MYQRAVLGSEEAMVGVAAVLAEAAKDPGRPVAVAVVDSEGELICYVRMDETPNMPRKLALRKAYTAGCTGTDGIQYKEVLGKFGISATDMDPQFVAFPGGVAIRQGAALVGGFGVSGRSADEDEALARIGVAALGL